MWQALEKVHRLVYQIAFDFLTELPLLVQPTRDGTKDEEFVISCGLSDCPCSG
jgi:hypothetical protein